MRRLLAGLFALALVTVAPHGLSGVAAAGRRAPASLDLRVMTFNLRYASDTKPNSWPERRPVMKQVITTQAPDVIGTQEGLYQQLKDMGVDLPAYEWIGLGRDGGSRGEFMAIFYRRDRFEPLAFDHFWLSDTPDVIGSSTWGNSNRRMVTWVLFRDRESGREFYVWNTHLDHEIEIARRNAAALIRDRLAKAETAVPLVLVGDFNSPAGNSPAYDILTKEAHLADTWPLARRRTNDGIGTFHNFKGPAEGAARIDWILARGRVDVPESAIVTFAQTGQYPSDHFPVVATLRF
ncbi:MAG: endonuclease/exonuclease/phosphatase family protein [Bacteroidales bacterium]